MSIIHLACKMTQKLQPVVLSGPSGCGKSTLIKKLTNEFPSKFGFSVSRKLLFYVIYLNMFYIFKIVFNNI